MVTKKKTVVVVKTLNVSPKRKLFLSRPPEESQGNNNDMESSNKGNTSPKKPERTAEGAILSRSVLGDPAVFDSIDRIVPDELKTLQPSRSRKMLTASRNGMGTGKSAHKKENDDEDEARKDRAREHPLTEPGTYLELLGDLTKAANKSRGGDMAKETKLLTMLSMEESNLLKKEAKVLALWQERQRDWHTIQRNLGKRVAAGPAHTLMMNAIDEFRTKTEEYDLLQAVIPAVEKFGEAEWAMGLRGGGTRSVAVGHLFSGLECEQKAQTSAPGVVRMPRSAVAKLKQELTATGVIKAKVQRAPSLALRRKRNRLKEQLQAARPHTVTLDNADALVVGSRALFAWAKESSAQYFSDVKDREEEENRQGEIAASQLAADQLVSLASEAGSVGRPLDIPSTGAMVQLLDPSDILLQGDQGEIVHKSYSFVNLGSVALNYTFKPLGGCWERAAQGSEVGHIYEQLEARDAASAPRGHALQRVNASFFSAQRTGRALPGETVTVRFSFLSKGSPGVIAQDWELVTFPRAKFIPFVSEESIEYGAPAAKIMDESLEIALRVHGYATTVDDNHSARRELARKIQRRCMETAAGDEVAAVVRVTRVPLCDSAVDARYREHFEQTNAVMLGGLNGPALGRPVLNITPERYADMVALATAIGELCTRVDARLSAGRADWVDPAEPIFAGAESKFDPEAAVSAAPAGDSDWAPLPTEEEAALAAEATEVALAALRTALLPEEVLRSFDEVDPARFQPSWDGDMGTLQAQLYSARNAAMRVGAIEAAAVVRFAVSEKLRLKAEKELAKASRKKGDDDDDDDEEEDEDEEEEEEDDDGEKEEPPKHPLLAEVDTLLASSRGMVTRLVILPKECEVQSGDGGASSLATSCKGAIEAAADALVDAYETMLEEAALPEGEVMAPLPSPYATKGGAARWAAAAAGPVEAEVADPKAKGKAPAVPDVAPEAALDALRLKVVAAASEAMLDSLVDALAEGEAVREAAARAARLPAELVGVVRATDLARNTKMFMHFDGDAFTGVGADSSSAFDNAQLRQRQACRPIVSAAEGGARMMVLLYESPAPGGADTHVPSLAGAADALRGHIGSLVTAAPKLKKKRGKYILADGSAPEDARPHLSYEVLPCATVADLHMRLVALKAREGGYAGVTSPPSDERPYPAAAVTVLVLENVCMGGVVPAHPVLAQLEEEDDDETFSVGQAEFLAKRDADWVDPDKPHKVAVEVALDEETEDGVPVPGSAELSIYTDPALAVAELLKTTGAAWVECSQSMVFPHPSRGVLAAPHAKVAAGKRLVSADVREGLAWASIVLASHQAPEAFALQAAAVAVEAKRAAAKEALAAQKEAAAAKEAARVEREAAGEPEPEPEGEGEGEEGTGSADASALVVVPAAPAALSGLHSRLITLFPEATDASPTSLVVLGGAFRADKLRAMDALVDTQATVFLTGEMAIPFLPLLCDGYTLDLRKHRALVADARAACAALVNRARVRGARLVVPVDLQVSESMPSVELIDKVADSEARDEGGEYDGDVVVVELCAPPTPEPVEDEEGADAAAAAPPTDGEGEEEELPQEDMSVPPEAPAPLPAVDVKGFVLDVGPKTVDMLTTEVAAAALTLVWGPVGLVEVGAFQTGQRALVGAMDLRARTLPATAAPAGEEGEEGEDAAATAAAAAAAAADVFVPKMLIVGDATVEWTARIVDPDGSETHNMGDMVAAGVATYASRHSGLVGGVIGGFAALPMANTVARQAAADEWVFNTRVFVNEDDDDDDDDEEEEEEEDEDEDEDED